MNCELPNGSQSMASGSSKLEVSAVSRLHMLDALRLVPRLPDSKLSVC